MRKLIKITALVLCLVLLGVFLSGCSYIDEIRKTHAILSDDKSTITFRGKTYKKLPKTDKELYCTYNFFGDYYGNEVNITDEDVPVLLQEFFSHTGSYDLSKDVFCIFNIDVDFINANENRYYCNEADYDRYVEALKNDELDYIGFEYETWDLNAEYHFVLETANSVLNEEIMGFVKNPETMTKETYDKYFEESDAVDFECLQGVLFKCDESASVVEPLSGYDIVRSYEGNKAYFINYEYETAAELSEKSVKALKTEYFNGYYPGIVEEDGLTYFDY